MGLRALLAEEEDARLAAELAAAEADAAAKVQVPPLDKKENAKKHSRRTRAGNPRPGGNPRSTDGTNKGGNRKDDKTGDGEDEAGRRHRPPAKKKASSSPEASNRGAGAGADEAALGGGRRGRVGGDGCVGARGSGPAKPRASPKGTKPRESEPPQRGNGRGGRSRRGAPQQP